MFRKVTLALLPPLRLAPWRWPRARLRRAACSGRSTRITTTTGVMAMASASASSTAVTSDCYVTRRVLTPYGFRWRTVNICY